MNWQSYLKALKARTVLLLVLAVAATWTAVELERKLPNGCFDDAALLGPPNAGTALHPRLLRVQEGEPQAPPPPPCPQNVDRRDLADVMPWVSIALWLGFVASLTVDLEGRRKRSRRRRSVITEAEFAEQVRRGAERGDRRE